MTDERAPAGEERRPAGPQHSRDSSGLRNARYRYRPHTAGTPGIAGPSEAFVAAASADMLARMRDGERRGWGDSWKHDYPDAAVCDRVMRARLDLFHALSNFRRGLVGADEVRKRAADVANQAFMLADPTRLAEPESLSTAVTAGSSTRSPTMSNYERLADLAEAGFDPATFRSSAGETAGRDPLRKAHRLLMPPHPGEVYQSSALCSCGEWQYDADSFGDLTNEYRAVLIEHTAHTRAALTTAGTPGIDVERDLLRAFDGAEDRPRVRALIREAIAALAEPES